MKPNAWQGIDLIFMNPKQQKIIKKVATEVKRKLKVEGSGHDWWHIARAWNMAKQIGIIEGADMFVVELAILLHDIADWKFHNGDDTVGPKLIRQILKKHSVSTKIIDHICEIVIDMAFKGAKVKTEMKTLEGKVVQDADKLDAIGAIGVARTFAYSAYKNRPIYEPTKKPSLHQSKEEYFKRESLTAINHFYEKLLLLKDRMNTKTAKKLAEGRHRFMEKFLDRFFQEWDGKI